MLRTWDSIFAQPGAVQWLQQAYTAGRLPHGLIFGGPVGVGKGSVAEVLGALFLCPNAKNLHPCGACESCRLMGAGTHPDFHRVTRELVRFHDKSGKSKAVELAAEVIRKELVELAMLKANMGCGKVFVVERAELMNAHAQNSLLKTLEEPEGRTLIILVTDQPGSLLPTVRSRCQLVRFGPLPSDRVKKELISRGFDSVDASNAAALSDGSLGLALRWIEDGVIAPAMQLIARIDVLLASASPAAAEEALDDLPAWLNQAAEAYAEKQLERDPLDSKDSAKRQGVTLYLLLIGGHIRRSLPGMDPRRQDAACAMIDALAEAEKYLDGNVTIAVVTQQVSSNLAALHV